MKDFKIQIGGFRFTEMRQIKKGMSGDRKFFLKGEDGAHYLLRLSERSEYEKKKEEYEFLRQVSEKGLPVPKPFAFGCDEKEKSVYTLLSWAEGEEAEKILPTLSRTEQYRFGVASGKILRTLHDHFPVCPTKNWQERYFDVMGERIAAYRAEGVPFRGDSLVLDFLEEKKHLLTLRPQTRHHGDYHTGNMIIGQGGISVIDWHTVDFDNYGDPWYEFNRIGIENTAFATGQVDGYFRGEIPQEFWELLAYYFTGSAITSIVWAKYFAPNKLQEILNLNENIVRWFHEFRDFVPDWYDKSLQQTF